jgi:multidrug transporter EmrE-like cation transporter
MSWGMLLLGVVMNIGGIYIIKMRINSLGAVQFDSVKSVVMFFVSILTSPLAVFGGIITVLACLPYAIAISKLELSIAYPLSVALSCLIVVPLTAIYFGEGITANKMIGIAMILGSLYFLYK